MEEMHCERGMITPNPTVTHYLYQVGTDATLSLSNVQMVRIRATGGGGGGGYGGLSDDTGGGGGAGGYAEVWLDSAYIRSSGELHQLTYTVGAAGTAGTSSSVNGGEGGSTTVKLGNTSGILLMTCNGGKGGMQGNSLGYGGTGGTASHLAGKGFSVQGNPGESGRDAGTVVLHVHGGNGAWSLLGRGGRGAVKNAAADFTDAESGDLGGGGGGGLYDTTTPTTYRDGGLGGSGCVMFTVWSY